MIKKQSKLIKDKVVNGTYQDHVKFIFENERFLYPINKTYWEIHKNQPIGNYEETDKYIDSQDFPKGRKELLKRMSRITYIRKALVKIVKQKSKLYEGKKGIGEAYFAKGWDQ